jgi:photosystem II stability/assembly factor-like uncharacterized protein
VQRWTAALLLLLVGGPLLLAMACGGGGATKTTPSPSLVTRAPKASSFLYLSLRSFYFVDAETGWLSASSCRDEPHTPPGGPRTPPPPPPVCKPGFYGTTDSGQTWRLLSHHAISAFVMDGSGVGLALAVATSCQQSPCETRILRTTDGGRHWTETYRSALGGGLTVIDSEAWLLGKSCGPSEPTSCDWYLLTSTDGGSTWTQTTIPIKGLHMSLSRPTKHDAWIASSSEIEVTHDAGRTWASLPYPTGGAFDSEIVFRSAQHGWLVIGGLPYNSMFQDKWLYGTTDGGATWAPLFGRPDDILGNLGPLVFTSDQNGWIATAHGGLSHTTDGGIHWSHVGFDRGQTDPNPVVQFADSQHGWTTSDDYSSFTGPRKVLWSTSDGGATWQKLPLPAPERP